MPVVGPIKRKELIAFLKKLGFDGPYSGGKHQFMIKGTLRLTIPNPHQSDIGKDLLSKILKQAGIEKEEWESLK
ncbi:MAG TPA: type II toxin-antitoxin system HicA family toxin [Flavisolibacter sp.]|jgi:predicted RNA binding protein YcfA (HicA-like mRNA interferase family)